MENVFLHRSKRSHLTRVLALNGEFVGLKERTFRRNGRLNAGEFTNPAILVVLLEIIFLQNNLRQNKTHGCVQ